MGSNSKRGLNSIVQFKTAPTLKMSKIYFKSFNLSSFLCKKSDFREDKFVYISSIKILGSLPTRLTYWNISFCAITIHLLSFQSLSFKRNNLNLLAPLLAILYYQRNSMPTTNIFKALKTIGSVNFLFCFLHFSPSNMGRC